MTTENEKKTEDLEQTNFIVPKEKLLEAGVYFGHKSREWNPKMAPYIHSKKGNTHIIDIVKTFKTLTFAYSIIKKYAEKDASFIFVGTRKQAQDTVKENALRTNSFYINKRWLGGILTNKQTIQKRVRRMFELEKMAETNFSGYTKKEGVLFAKELEKLQANLSGIKTMRRRPDFMIIADPKHDEIAIKEARKSGVKIVGIVDTNVDPGLVDIAIPANDDSTKSVMLIITVLADAIADAKNGKMLFAYQDASQIVFPESTNRRRDNDSDGRFRNNRRFGRSNDRRSFDRDNKDGQEARPRRHFDKDNKDGQEARPRRPRDTEGKKEFTKKEFTKKEVNKETKE